MMTKQEKYEILGCLGFGVVLYLLTKSVAFAVFLPLGGFGFYFASRRANAETWLVRMDAEEACYRKPLARRVLNGVLAAVFFAVLIGLCYFFVTTGGKGAPPFIPLVQVVLTLIVLLFVWSAGPTETRFDLQHRRVWYRVGLPFFARWQSRDAADIAALRVQSMRGRDSRSVLIAITWQSRRGPAAGTTVSFHYLSREGTRGGSDEVLENVRAAAELIGERLSVPVEVLGPGLTERARAGER